MGSSDPISTTHHHVQAFVVLACLAVVLAVASAEPRYHKLQKVGCSITEVAACAGEIEDAWSNCWDAADIMSCINGIIGASDCGVCICDVLGWLGLMDC